ncbi:hypothetical protein SeMB42_g07244 [Synchytrium endobioticum]|uniref:NADP-dependent oxidoreductase domain-containing protein n=1 Tax=Synchytrium endobioticum TaxID=286115 RepID=A0A507CAD9_9FUNG|nr:hypothetical protein SeMB42_g07244 [Synchytrium endobioticum]TPX39523.1 hypothetical protein SeLEV6574_g07151 [Synchytrium endobioticum]
MTYQSMKYRYLGSSGLKVSEICLGSTFSLPSSKDERQNIQTSFDVLNEFLHSGGNFIDTANIYMNGGAEKTIGTWLKTHSRRDDLVIATKASKPMGTGPNDAGSSRKHLVKALEASLERLGTTYIDLYQIHCHDRGTSVRETLMTLNDFVRAGKIRYIGLSNYTGSTLQKAVGVADALGAERIVSLQQEYSLLERGYEFYDLMDVCWEEQISCLPWSPLKAGWLSGKYTRCDATYQPNSRAAHAASSSSEYATLANDATFSIIDEISAISNEINHTPTAVSIRWLLQKPTVAAAVIGVRNPTQLKDNLEATTFELTPEQMKRLDDKSKTPLIYPWRFIENANPHRGRKRARLECEQ